jgi:hypothetical protein
MILWLLSSSLEVCDFVGFLKSCLRVEASYVVASSTGTVGFLVQIWSVEEVLVSIAIAIGVAPLLFVLLSVARAALVCFGCGRPLPLALASSHGRYRQFDVDLQYCLSRD